MNNKLYRLVVRCRSALQEELVLAYAEIEELEWSSESRATGENLRVSLFCGADDVPEDRVRSLEIFLASALAEFGEAVPPVVVRPLRQDWPTAWKRFFRGRPIAGRFFIHPPWETPAAVDPALIPLVIDAGTAFGTGHHPTTALCLAALAARGAEGARVLDAGCGSGILAIAACRLGAASVLAFDIDDDALVQARQNAAANGTAAQISFLSCTVQTLTDKGPYDIVFANMLPAQFLPVAEYLPALLAPSGWAVFSGILEERADETARLLADCGLVIRERLAPTPETAGWTAFVVGLP